MIDYVYKELYNQDSVDKQLRITFDGGEITNAELYSEGMELTQSLCSESELRFGSCEASVLKLKVANVYDSLKDKWLTVTETIGGNTDESFQFGKYKVYSDTPDADYNYRDIVAYDAMYDIINTDVAEWYNSIFADADSAITLKEFRDSFALYFGLEQEKINLVNDDMVVEKTIEPSELSGKTVIGAICELNGCFGQIGNDGKLKYITLPKYSEDTFPAYDLYPSDSLIPGQMQEPLDITGGKYIDCQYEDYITDCISKLQIRQEESDIGVVVGTGGNCYIVQDNFLVYGKGKDDLEIIANNMFGVIDEIAYTPFSASLAGNPCIEVGDSVKFHTRKQTFESYVLERTLKGIQALKDTFHTNGVKQYAEKVNSVRKEIVQLKGKTNTLERNVEQTKSEIKDVEAGLTTKIEQNEDKIVATVLKLENNNADVANLKKQVQTTMTSERVKLEIQSELSNGTTKVTTNTGFVLDDEGLSITKSGKEMSTQITEDGMTVNKNNEQVLVANNEGVIAKDLYAESWLVVGTNSRFEDYGSKRTGCFWIGG